MLPWNERGHHPIVHRRIRPCDRGNRNMPSNFHSARDLMMQFQSLTTAIVNYISTAGAFTKWHPLYVSPLSWLEMLEWKNQMELGGRGLRDEFEGTAFGEILRIFFCKGLYVSCWRIGGRTFVSSHNVGMVSLYSCRDMVNPYL